MTSLRLPLRRRTVAVALGTAALLALTACSGAAEPGATSTPAASDASEGPATLQTLAEGTLTIATGEPAYSPWVEDDDPESGRGFEAAVAYAVADQLGFAEDEVTWVRSTFDSAVAPGAKPWDLNIQQFSITDERRQAVDFSSPYYETTQAVVTTSGSDADGAASLADLEGLTLGAAASTTSLDVATERFGQPRVFNNNDDAVQALSNGQIDAIVVDLPTAFFIAAAQLDEGVVVGQIADSAGGDEFGFVLPKGSALTAPVTEAVDALRDSGGLQDITDQWLSTEVDAPVLG